VQLQPLVYALREEVLSQQMVQADENTLQMLAPGKRIEPMSGPTAQHRSRN
jgi:hypothetical protein